jgi:hypothetical protein
MTEWVSLDVTLAIHNEQLAELAEGLEYVMPISLSRRSFALDS